MATTNTAIVKEAAAAGAAAERDKAKAKAEAERIERIEKRNRQLENINKKLINAPQPVNFGIVAGAGAAGAAAGFKLQKKLADTTKEWVLTAEQVPDQPDLVGTPTTSAKMVKDVLVPVLGLGMAVGGAFVSHPTLSAIMMGGGTGLATGSVISSALDPTP